MAKLCELTVTGKTDGTIVVANRILKGKISRLVPFNTVSQLEGALVVEKNGLIKIEGGIPEHVKSQMSQKGKDRFSNQTFGLAAESNPEAKAKMPVPSNKKEDVEDVLDPGADSSIAELPVVSNKQEDVEDTSGESADSTIATFSTPSVESDEEVSKGLTREKIIEMSAKELGQYIKDNKLEITGVSKMNARQLTEKLLEHFGYEALAEDEKN